MRNHAVQPNETVTYFWTMARSDGPTGSDLGCLTRFYFSNVDMDRDLASGLIGPLLICAKNMLDSYARLVRNSLLINGHYQYIVCKLLLIFTKL